MANTKITSNVISDDIALGGNPTTTTQSAGNDTTRIATTAFVKAAIDATIDSAPGALDTLNELAAAIGDDANFSTTITNSIATKLPLAGGTVTGTLTLSSADPIIKFTDTGGGDTFGIFASASNYLGFYNFTDSRTDMMIDGAGVLKLLPTRSTYVDASEDANARSHMFVTNDGVGDFNQEAGHLVIQARTHTSVYRDIIFAGGINNADTLMAIKGEGQIDLGGYGNLKGNSGAPTRLEINSVSTAGYLSIAGTEKFAWNATDIRPIGVNTLDLGANGAEFRTLYLDTSLVASNALTISTGTDLTLNPSGIVELETAGNILDGSYYSSLTINNTGSSTYSRVRFDRSGVARWGVGIKPGDQFHISKLYNGASDDVFVIADNGYIGIGTSASANKLTVSDATNISMSAAAAGQLRIEGNGYSGAIALNGSAMHIYQNSSARDIVMGNNETAQFKIHRTGEITAPQHPIFDVGIGAAGSGVRVFNVVYVNIGSNYSTTNGKFTAPVAGTYFFQTAFIKNNNANVARRRFNKNGTALYSSRQMRMDSGQAYGDPGTLAVIVTLAVGDYIQVDQYAGESLGSVSYDYFHGYLIA